MTPRERVHRALAFEETDVVPYHVNFTEAARQKAAEFFADPDFESSVGNHLAVLSHRKATRWVEIAPGHLRDEWGVVWNRTIDRDIGVVENLVIPEPDVRYLTLPEPESPDLAARYPQFIENNQDRFRVVTIGFSLFERAWSLRGMDRLLMDMIDSPRFVRDLFDAITSFNLAHVDLAARYDIDAILFGDDWGSQRGLIMGPELWREFIKPCLRRMYARVRETGKPVMIHCCGDVRAILPELVEIGLNVFNPFQPETMDIFETKKRYAGSLAFYGGISVQHLLPHGTPDKVRRETRHLLETLGRGGGYIASPSHDIPADVPAENIAAMIEVLREQ